MKRVLVVDDAAFMRLSIRNMLQNTGYEVIGEAENGREGVEKFVELRPDIVTMDITMPIMTGIEAVQAIVKIDPNATVIMLSAMGQEQMVKDAILSGAKSFIVKPFKAEILLKTFSQFI
ncbi:MAG: response regulator [Tissierellaceae bacterium]